MSSLLTEAIDGTVSHLPYDELCKKFLSHKEVLARIMQYQLEEYKNCTIEDIRDKYIEEEPEVGVSPVKPDQTGLIHGDNTEDVSLTEQTIRYDIRFHAIAPDSLTEDGEPRYIRLIINIEAQSQYNLPYPLTKRGIYYCSRLLSSQYGTVFEKSHYEKLQKVYSIWICTAPPGYRRNTITEYAVTEKTIVGHAMEKKENYDLLRVILVCLGDNEKLAGTGDTSEKLIRFLNTLLIRQMPKAERKEELSKEFGLSMTDSMEGEVSEMCNLSQGFIAEGELRGIVKGEKRGIAKGRDEEAVDNLKNLMEATGWSFEKAADTLKISLEKRMKFKQELGI